ncbi:MAG: hypothetical protein MUO87_09525 [Thermoplasmata archaeon]|nr:hypothetical protein [Thermoplasmata archaeon]
MSGYGPSAGRFVQVCESSEMILRRKTSPMPPAIGALAFVALFLGVISGMTLIHENEEVLGAILLIAPVALVVFLVIRAIKAPK